MNIQCTKCQKYKCESLFGDREEKENGKRSECYACVELRASKWRERNPEQVKKNKRIQYIRKRDIQTRNVVPDCDICRLKFDLTVQVGSKLPNSPHWDHNHETEEFRGWLCHNCNALLGHAGDNTGILQRAIDYLKMRGAGISKFMNV